MKFDVARFARNFVKLSFLEVFLNVSKMMNQWAHKAQFMACGNRQTATTMHYCSAEPHQHYHPLLPFFCRTFSSTEFFHELKVELKGHDVKEFES